MSDEGPRRATQGDAAAPEPVELRAPEGARRMEIDWSDGATTAYRHDILRGFCPCAHCQGHHGPVRWVQGAERRDLALADVQQVGNYALRLAWADGHDTGIYTFGFLRSLAGVGEAPIEDVRGERFSR